MSKIKKILSIFLLLFMSAFIVSCSSFAKEEKFLKIEKFEVVEKEEGNVLVITYADKKLEPTEVLLPKSEKGNGIKDVTYKLSDDKKETIVTITYTDETITPSEFKIPSGVSVEDISYKTEDGVTRMYITYSNGKVQDYPIIKGEDGLGIKKIEHEILTDKSVAINILYTDDTSYSLTIPAPQKGEDGRGIAAMGVSEDEINYIFNVTYTDGAQDEFTLVKPKVSTWHQVYEVPAASFGNDGDFAFDQVNKIIYSKTNGAWGRIVDFSTSIEKYKIVFDLNDENSDVKASLNGLPHQYLGIVKGTYFSTTGNGTPSTIPVPTRNGYVFEGWYTTAYPNDAINAKFTDLTPIMSDLYLYAKWSVAE